MRGPQPTRSLAHRCDEVLALIDAVLGETTTGDALTPPQGRHDEAHHTRNDRLGAVALATSVGS